MKRNTRKFRLALTALILLAAMVALAAVPLWAQTAVTYPGNSLTTTTGAYQSAVQAYPHKWDVTKGDLTIEGTIDLGGIQARGNTWDGNLTDGDDWFGLWTQIGLSKDPVFNSSDGVWMVTVEWTGGGDDLNTQIREILHMQEEPGTQPMPKLYTGPRTIAAGDGDDTYAFKLQIHSTGATTGGAKLWIDGVQVKGDMWSVFTPEEIAYSGEDLSSAEVLIGIMSGNNPNNPAHTFSWSDLTVTGYPASYSEVWVDDDWVGTTPGTEVKPGKYFGFNAFATIQDGIDAVSGSTVHVAAGTYAEYLHITTDNLTVQGAGIDQSIIDLDGLIPYWHYSPTGHFASRAGVLISGYLSPGTLAEVVENVTFRGFTVKNAGLNPPTPYPEFIDNSNGQDIVRGIVVANGKNILIQNCKVQNSGYNGIGVGKARCTTLKQSEGVTIDNCISSDNWETGISVGSYVGPITITNNICSNNKRPHPDPSSGREYSGKGIEVSGKSSSLSISGFIANNKCKNNGFEGIVLKNYADGVIVENNTVTGHNIDDEGAGIFFYGKKSTPANCKNNIIRNNKVEKNIRGIVAYYAESCTIEGNTIKTDSGSFPEGQEAIKIDGGHNILVMDNDISCDGVGIGVSNTWDDVESYDNTFTGNTIKKAKFAGIRIRAGAHDNEFMYNTIKDTEILTRWAGKPYEETQGDGVIIDDSAGPDNVFHYNNIYDNDDDGMENQLLTSVGAECNWWGHYTGPSGEGTGSGDAVSSYVDFDPWLAPPVSEFEIEHAKIDFKNKPDDDKVHVKGQLGLVCGVAISDYVTVTVGSLTGIIPGDTMVEKDGKWEYKRPKGGTGDIKHMTIDWKNGKFDFSMDKADLSGLTDPENVTISVRIGDDFGWETITMSEHKHHWDYKAKKPKKPKAVEIEPLVITDEIKVVAYPNPIRDVDTATFQVMGTLATQVEEIRVQIYDLSGRLVWEDTALGSELDWHTDCLSGDYLANGIYLYRVQLRIDGSWISQDLGKIAVLR